MMLAADMAPMMTPASAPSERSEDDCAFAIGGSAAMLEAVGNDCAVGEAVLGAVAAVMGGLLGVNITLSTSRNAIVIG